MRRRLLNGAALAAAGALGALGWVVVAQESQDPAAAAAIQAGPPSEATPPPAPPSTRGIATDEAGLPTAPVPYTVLVPQRPRAQQQQQSPTTTAPVAQGPSTLELQAPGDPPPLKPRVRHTTAVLQAVDKVTAETLRFEAEVGKPVRYKTLVFTLRACETEAEDEPVRESAAHLLITSRPAARPGRVQPEAAQVFRGWMFGSSPGLNPFEHPIYDAWLVSCKRPPEPVVAVPGTSQPGQPQPRRPVPAEPDAEAPAPQTEARAPSSAPG
jgi:hypothetical protein